MLLLDFLNLGGVELAIVAVIFFLPLALIVYGVFDIARSNFKNKMMRFVFLALVLFAPMLGSIIYLFIRKDYLKTKDATHPFR